jgi:hypothetical protein
MASRHRRRYRRAVFDKRASWSDEVICSALYADGEAPRPLVIDAWMFCARTLGLPPDKLRLDDALDGTLEPVEVFGGVSDRRVDLVERAEARLRAAHVACDQATFTTMGTIVRALVSASLAKDDQQHGRQA